ncbi:divalent metal cation transporter [Nodularia harveyana UHCC-0300]|uniref:Divalent metal cation transporter n=1 Tax=Nodularia harveyana UHCC-0300 TaxID=2974287 RepID=A0ABU5UJW1_9CYAN|nr:divalent metal cation transporter [Nodularia harveyana]MEA5583236.1 divalent metal cation transporter [Nodularia harveyana UHCC-0300]
MAILLQLLCVRLGVATGQDLAQACGNYFSSKVSFCLWVLCERMFESQSESKIMRVV